MNKPLDKEEVQLRLLRLLEKNPELTQRDMTRGTGVSLGKVNYCLSELSKQGFIRIERFRKSKNKSAYMYHLTPAGIEAIGRLAYNFLRRKVQEYDALKKEIVVLGDLLRDMDTQVSESDLRRCLKGIVD